MSDKSERRGAVAARLAQIWLAVVILAAVFAPWLSPHPPDLPLFAPLSRPSLELPFGADALGRDFWSRMVYGARLSLILASFAAAVTVVVGGIAGFAAAVVGGPLERAIHWLSNVLLAIPGLLLAMLFVAAWGPGVAAVAIAVGLGFAPSFGRVTRSVISQLSQEGYVLAAQASGGSRLWISSRHLLPNGLPQLAPLAGTYLAWAFLAVTTLTFLGLAGDPSIPEWGALLNASRTHLQVAPRLAALPAIAITLTILSVHSLSQSPSTP